MKIKTLIAIAGSITATAFAGGSKEVIAPIPPPPPALGGWFIGGTYGQFESDSNIDDYDGEAGTALAADKFDFDMYTLQMYLADTKISPFLPTYLESREKALTVKRAAYC